MLVTGCTGGRSPALACPGSREMRELVATESSAATASSADTIAEVTVADMMLRQARAPSELESEWKTLTEFMDEANAELQALGTPPDGVAFEAAWGPLSAELTGDGEVGRSAQAIISYADDTCSLTAPATDGY